MWQSASARKFYRQRVIKAWFNDLERIDGPGMLLMSWEPFMSVDEWWDTILDMVSLAHDDRCLGSIAAGPLEHLLVMHGNEVIELVESQAKIDFKFRSAVRRVWKNRIPDEVWQRILVLSK